MRLSLLIAGAVGISVLSSAVTSWSILSATTHPSQPTALLTPATPPSAPAAPVADPINEPIAQQPPPEPLPPALDPVDAWPTPPPDEEKSTATAMPPPPSAGPATAQPHPSDASDQPPPARTLGAADPPNRIVADGVQAHDGTDQVNEAVLNDYFACDEPELTLVRSYRSRHHLPDSDVFVVCFVARHAGIAFSEAFPVFINDCSGSCHALVQFYRIDPSLFFIDCAPGTTCPPLFRRPYQQYWNHRLGGAVFSNEEYHALLALHIASDFQGCSTGIFFQLAQLHQTPIEVVYAYPATCGVGGSTCLGRPIRPSPHRPIASREPPHREPPPVAQRNPAPGDIAMQPRPPVHQRPGTTSPALVPGGLPPPGPQRPAPIAPPDRPVTTIATTGTGASHRPPAPLLLPIREVKPAAPLVLPAARQPLPMPITAPQVASPPRLDPPAPVTAVPPEPLRRDRDERHVMPVRPLPAPPVLEPATRPERQSSPRFDPPSPVTTTPAEPPRRGMLGRTPSALQPGDGLPDQTSPRR